MTMNTTTATTTTIEAILSLRSDIHPRDSHLFRASLLAFAAFYYAVSPYYKSPKQKSWILTSLSSFAMTACSIPFLIDYLRGGCNVTASPLSSPFAHTVNKIFQAYLVADLTLGALHYRNQMNLLSGWIHHALYVCVTEYAMRRGLAGVFALAAFMEAPTFLLGFGSLHPRARTDVGFALVFFVTRIVFNLALIYAYVHPANRNALLGGSFVPASVLTAAFGMHAMWFKGCIDGFVKRARQAKAKKSEGVKVVGLKGLEVSSEPVAEPVLVPVAATTATVSTPVSAPRFATLPRRRERKTFRAEIPPPSNSKPNAHTYARPAIPEDYLSASWHAGASSSSARTPPLLFSGSGSSDTDSDEEVHTPFDGERTGAGTSAASKFPIMVVGVDSDGSSSSGAPSNARSMKMKLGHVVEPVAKPWVPPAQVPVLRLPLGRTDVDAMGARARLRLRELRERIRARGADVYGRLRLRAGAIAAQDGGVWGYHEPELAGVVPGGYVGVGAGVEAAERASPTEVVAY